MKEETGYAVCQSGEKRKKTDKINLLSLLTIVGYVVASLFNLPLTVPIAPLSNSSGSSLETKELRGPVFSQRKARSGLSGRFTIQ